MNEALCKGNPVVPDIARGEGTKMVFLFLFFADAVYFMHDFKKGSMESIDIEAMEAVRKGDDAALMSAGIRHTILQLLLPGDPRELALFLAGGELLKPAAGAVGSVLVKTLPDYFSMPIGLFV